MPQGILHVILIRAKGLKDTDFLSNMDPYAVLTCRTREKKSGVATGRGSEPEWNESFLFTISEGASELLIKLWDNDTGRKDDVIGVATVPEGIYNVVKDEEYCGEIKLSLLFRPEEESRGNGEDEET
ncbi:hypothetical protein MKW92_049741 [Papaver armeniacum]|nr:hypothetical protein MKW92_049741 [Papaver armeniacum]